MKKYIPFTAVLLLVTVATCIYAFHEVAKSNAETKPAIEGLVDYTPQASIEK